MIMISILTCVVFVNLLMWVAYTGGKVSRITPLIFFLHIYLGIMVLPGLINLTLYQPDVLVIKKQVSEESIHTALALSIIITAISVFWVRFERRALNTMRHSSIDHINFCKLQSLSLLALLVLAAIISLRGIKNIPLYYILTQDFHNAALVKFNFMKGNLPKVPEILNQTIRYLFPLLTFFIGYNFVEIRKPKIAKISWFIIILLGTLVAVGMDGHKVPPFMILVSVLLLFAIRKKQFISLKNVFFVTTLSLILFTLFLHSVTPAGRNITDLFIERIFFGQTAGAIFIIDRFDPNFELIKHGFIGASYFFSQLPEHAHSSIMKTVYGISNTNVNMNSIFIGEAFSWGGMTGAYLSIVFMFLYVPLAILVISRLSRRNTSFYFPMSAVFFGFYFPILQGFNSFLYGRNIIFFIIMAVIFSLTRTYVLRRKQMNQ